MAHGKVVRLADKVDDDAPYFADRSGGGVGGAIVNNPPGGMPFVPAPDLRRYAPPTGLSDAPS